MKLRQNPRVDFVGLHARVGDGLHLKRVRDHDLGHERRQQPYDGRGVPGCFQYDFVILSKLLPKGHHSVVIQVHPKFFGDLAPVENRDLREILRPSSNSPLLPTRKHKWKIPVLNGLI